MINFKHLRYFWVTAKAGGIVRASERLHLTPQTLSGQIKLLEDQLGRSLLRKRGRQLELTEAGRVALRYADEIFGLGAELESQLARLDDEGGPIDLRVGIVDSVPKTVSCHLLRPGLELDRPVRLVCKEGAFADLLAQLALHRLDLVLAQEPLPRQLGVRAFGHLLGRSAMGFYAVPALVEALGPQPFPACLNGAPLLVQGSNHPIRHKLDAWLARHDLHPRIVAEFDDGALMKAFGREGRGVFLASAMLAAETREQYGADLIGRCDDLVEEFHAISLERRSSHPCIAAIMNAAGTTPADRLDPIGAERH